MYTMLGKLKDDVTLNTQRRRFVSLCLFGSMRLRLPPQHYRQDAYSAGLWL